MSQPSLIPADDLAILKATPALLDAFLPPALQSTTTTTLERTTALEHSTAPITAEESVEFSRAFVETARNGALKLVTDGAEGTLGRVGEDIERVRAEAEQLRRSLDV